MIAMIGAYVKIFDFRNKLQICEGIIIQQKYVFVHEHDERNHHGFSHFAMHDIIFCCKDGNEQYYTYIHDPTCYEIFGSSAVKQECCNHENYKITLFEKDSYDCH